MAISVRVDVRPDAPRGTVNPNIYGQLLSRRRWVADESLYDPTHPDADDTGVRRDVRDAIAAAAPPIIRWPGGCTGTTYEWTDAIGPQDSRPASLDWHMGYDVGNGFGTAEFIHFCRSIGAQPQINLPVAGGDLRTTLDWVEYVNSAGYGRCAQLRRSHGYPDPWKVRYWQIGNEEWGEWEIGQRDAHDYAILLREWAKAIKRLDAETQILGVGSWRAQDSIDWNLDVLRTAWEHLDYLTAHTYWRFNPAGEDEGYDSPLCGAFEDDQAITMLEGLVRLIAREKNQTRHPKLAFTEWNACNVTQREMSPSWRPGRAQFRLVDALACAGFLNALQRHASFVTLANFAQSINVVGALVVTDDAVLRESVYWALHMQRHHSGRTAVVTTTDTPGREVRTGHGSVSLPDVDVSATRDESTRRLFLSIVNRNRTDEAVCTVRFLDTSPKPSAKVWELWAEDPLATNSFDQPERIRPASRNTTVGRNCEICVKPHSYTIVEVRL